MRIYNLLKRIQILILIVNSCCFIKAMNIDPEFDSFNPTQAKITGSYYKNLINPVIGTDTEVLLKCYSENTIRPYATFVGEQIKNNVNNWIDSLLSYNGDFVSPNVAVGCNLVDRTRDSFKNKFAKAIDESINFEINLSEEFSIYFIVKAQSTVYIKIAKNIDSWVDTLQPAYNGDFLHEGVILNLPNGPEDRTKNSFKNALIKILINY